MLKRLFANVDGRSIAILLAILAAVVLLWGTVLVAPLKIFVVLMHEVSHGTAAVLTGGEVVRIEINAQQGGVAYTRGGVRFVILTAGYLGSMLWGGLILLLASRTKWDRYISMAIGGLLLIVTLFFVRTTFGFIFALVFSVAMIVMGWKLSQKINDIVLKVIGITSCMYAVLDILDDVLKRPGIGSDADMLAEHTGIPGVIWGVVWITAAVTASGFFLILSAKRTGPPEDAGETPVA